MTEDRPHSFVSRHLITSQQFEVHGFLFKFYSDSSLEVNKELLAHVGNQGMVFSVEARKAHRKERGDWQVLVSWVGLQDQNDSWNPLRAMNEEISSEIVQYVLASDDEELSTAYKKIFLALVRHSLAT